MKKLLVIVFVCLALCAALSCASVDPVRKYPNMVADMDPVSAGSIEVRFDRMLSSNLNELPVDVVFYPRLNAVALEFRYEFVRYRQFWPEAGRRQFIDALKFYKEDYAGHKLLDKYSKTRSIYGKVKASVEWETFKYSTTHTSSPNIELGYRFRPKSSKAVYFTVLQRSAKEEEGSGDSANLESLQISMYFTRAQAEELATLFDQTFLLGLVGSRAAASPVAAPSDDEYYE